MRFLIKKNVVHLFILFLQNKNPKALYTFGFLGLIQVEKIPAI
jgi:hypothetical protein